MRKSSWIFDTSSGGSVGFEIFTAGKGKLWFHNDAGATTNYWYAAAGASLGIGPQALEGMSASGGTKDMFSAGTVYMTDGFTGSELEPGDMEGFCLITDVSLSAGVGGSATVLFTGMDTGDLLDELGYGPIYAVLGPSGEFIKRLLQLVADSNDLDLPKLVRSKANALIVLVGQSDGTPSVSISRTIGRMELYGNGVQYVPQVDLKPPPEDVGMRFNSSGHEEGPPIILPGDMLFDFDKSDLKPAATSALMATKSTILNKRNNPLLIEGYTDSIGSDNYNYGLSKRRAEAVKKWLTDQGLPNTMYTRGYGKEDPVASNKMREGRRKNRRVVIKVMQSTWRPR